MPVPGFVGGTVNRFQDTGDSESGDSGFATRYGQAGSRLRGNFPGGRCGRQGDDLAAKAKAE